MRILVDARPIAEAQAGGVSRVARELVAALIEQKADDEIILATTGVGAIHELPLRRDTACRVPTHIHLRIPNKLWSAGCVSGLFSLDREIEKQTGKIDAIFLPNLGFVGQIHRPYVLLLHDLSFIIEPKWFSPRMRLWHRAVDATRLIKNASHLLAVSETTKRDAIRLLNIPPERITVIPIGPTLDKNVILRESGATEGSSNWNTCREHQTKILSEDPSSQTPQDDISIPTKFILAFSGNARKNADTSIAAVDILRRDPQFSTVELVLIGPQKKNVIPSNAEGSSNWNSMTKIPRQTRNDISFIQTIPHPSDSELSDLYSSAACVLYPSWYEGFGLPLHEAASFGTPCVASSAGALPETAPIGTLHADPAKPHHLAETLRLAVTRLRPQPATVPEENWRKAAEMLKNALQDVKKG